MALITDAMAFLLAVSNLRREGREIGRLVIDVQPFAVLQPPQHPVGYRGQQHSPTHLQRILGEKDRHHLRGRPDVRTGRAPRMERVWLSVRISVDTGSKKKKKQT